MKLSLSIAAALPALALSLSPTRVNEFDLKHAAVTALAPSYSNDGECELLVTTFYPFGDDSVNAVSTPMTKPTLEVVDAKAKWPNQADPVSASEAKKLGISRGILSANGFFVSPTKSTGAVTLYDTSDLKNVTATKISTDKKGYFYHHAEFADIDGDASTVDVVAARAYKSSFNPFGKPDGELVWIKKQSDGTWTEQVLAKGPGVAFVQDDIDGDGKIEFIAAQFFLKQQLAVYSCDGENWAACASNQSLVRTTVVDNDSNIPFFNVQVFDLNNDGKKDLLATTNTANGKGSVLGYEQPQNWRDGGEWKKHRIAEGYKPTKSFLPGRGSPGTATAFHATKGASGKPQVIVSADDGGYVSLLTPTSQDQGDWEYTNERIVNSTDTIGTIAIGFCDGDEYVDFFVPLFAENKVAAYTFK